MKFPVEDCFTSFRRTWKYSNREVVWRKRISGVIFLEAKLYVRVGYSQDEGNGEIDRQRRNSLTSHRVSTVFKDNRKGKNESISLLKIKTKLDIIFKNCINSQRKVGERMSGRIMLWITNHARWIFRRKPAQKNSALEMKVRVVEPSELSRGGKDEIKLRHFIIKKPISRRMRISKTLTFSIGRVLRSRRLDMARFWKDM